MTIRDNVAKILKDYPETRNSDKLLILKYWELVDKLPMDNIDKFREAFVKKSTNTESIRRARQLIQEEGKFLPTDKHVIEKRRRKEQLMIESIVNEREVV